MFDTIGLNIHSGEEQTNITDYRTNKLTPDALIALDHFNKWKNCWCDLFLKTPRSKTEYTSNLEWKEFRRDPHYISEKIEFGDSEKPWVKRHFNVKHEKSSNYFVNYQLHPTFIRLEFSIPKYMWGTNLAQFITSVDSPRYGIYCREWDTAMSQAYDNLIRFLKAFLAENLIKGLRGKFIEIYRLDICHNQVFRDLKAVQRYQEFQRSVRLPNLSAKTKTLKEYGTTIAVARNHYYFKIYQKGAEYERNDKKEHIRLNRMTERDLEELTDRESKEKAHWFNDKKPIEYDVNGFPEHWENNMYTDEYGWPIGDPEVETQMLRKVKKYNKAVKWFDIGGLQSLSDRMLRYEITYRNSGGMSWLYKKHIHRKRDPEYIKFKRRYRLINNVTRSGTEMEKVTPSDARFYRKFRSEMHKTHKFYLSVSEELHQHERDGYFDTDVTEAWFSPALLGLLMGQFKQMFDMYQVTEIPRSRVIMDALEEHNKEVERKREQFAWKRYQGEWRLDVNGNKYYDIKLSDLGRPMLLAVPVSSKEWTELTGLKLKPIEITSYLGSLERYGDFNNWQLKAKLSNRDMRVIKKKLNILGVDPKAQSMMPLYDVPNTDFTDYYEMEKLKVVNPDSPEYGYGLLKGRNKWQNVC